MWAQGNDRVQIKGMEKGGVPPPRHEIFTQQQHQAKEAYRRDAQ